MNQERTSEYDSWYLTEPEGLALPDGTGYAFGATLW